MQQPLFVDEKDVDFYCWLRNNYPTIKDPHDFVLREKAAFPNLDLLQTAKQAFAWEQAQPRVKKHKARFLHNWFARTASRPTRKAAITPETRSGGSGYVRLKD